MIQYMQFIDDGISFSISELDSESQITVTMSTIGIGHPEYSIIFSEEEIVKLKQWLDEAYKALEHSTG